MCKIKKFLKKALAPITIMIIPHEKAKLLNIRIPSIVIPLSLFLSLSSFAYLATLAVHGLEYEPMKQKLNYYSREVDEWSSTVKALKKAELETVNALKKAEADFRQIFALKSQETVLETIDAEFSGAIDFTALKKELESTVETVDEIKDYLRIQKDIYLATPKGAPVKGRITSEFGKREDPIRDIKLFHSGVDISASPGTSIEATADGVVSYSAWQNNSGYLIVIEHGCGFSTIYTHNKTNLVKVGQRVKREEVIGYVGSTGKSTGPHVHYEVWKDGKHVNPQHYFKTRS
jgi:murein DD-endopeptidase MepM/ murein hydrolase activator NlpD